MEEFHHLKGQERVCGEREHLVVGDECVEEGMDVKAEEGLMNSGGKVAVIIVNSPIESGESVNALNRDLYEVV